MVQRFCGKQFLKFIVFSIINNIIGRDAYAFEESLSQTQGGPHPSDSLCPPCVDGYTMVWARLTSGIDKLPGKISIIAGLRVGWPVWPRRST